MLYPVGISSECWLIYKAVEPAKKIRQECAWLLQLILAAYVPGELAPSGCGGWIANGCRVVYFVYAYDGAEEEGYAWEAGEES